MSEADDDASRSEVTTVRTVGCINDAFEMLSYIRRSNFSQVFKRHISPFLFSSCCIWLFYAHATNKQNRWVVCCEIFTNANASDNVDASDCTYWHPCSQRKPREGLSPSDRRVLLSRRSLRAKSHFLSPTPAIYFHHVRRIPGSGRN